MAFTDSEKTEIRRYCGFPMFGAVPTAHFGYRYFTSYGLLEYRMNNLSVTEEDTVRDLYLPNLRTLESALMLTSDNLDTAKAAVWTHNPNEQDDRDKLFTSWRLRLSNFFGVPFGESGSSTVKMVV